jgi:alpha-L-rhamnosidase
MENKVSEGLMILIGLTIGYRTHAQNIAFRRAGWISAPNTIVCPVFACNVHIRKPIKSAMLIITAHGLYEALVNGKKVGEAYFTPGWTNYNKQLQYQNYNVTEQINPGNNLLQVTLSGGWYSGVFGEDMKTANYGKGTALLCSLQVTYTDGSKQAINSDSSWRCGIGPILRADFYSGEIQDTRLNIIRTIPVIVLDMGKAKLVPTLTASVTAQEVFNPKKIWKNSKGEQVIDFGQNLAGFVRLTVKGKAGDTVRISHAELLDREGNLFTSNLRAAKATDSYILSGKTQFLTPHFTYHGFRYAKITGIKITKDEAVAVAIHSKLQTAGGFSCSDPILNQLQHNILWSMNSNFVDIPTDCPQRSERFGWTGDAQVFCATAAYNKNVLAFYRKWLTDLRTDQGTNGAVPVVIPDLEQPKDTVKQGVSGWGDAATIMPLSLYQIYGDKKILADQYASMKAWVDYITTQSPDCLWMANGYGDWYAMGDKTSLPFIDQCFYYHSTELLIDAAKVLGKKADVETYTALAGKIKKAFAETYHFDTKSTRTQTAYILALNFNLLPESDRQKAADSLVKRIHENNDHLATGFLGTPYLLPVLTRFGYNKVAYTLLLQQSCPSWLYPLTKGATTIWERWDAIKPDGTLQQCSFNHYAYGAVGQWLYEDMLGIKPASPGFKTIFIQPHPDARLKWAKGSYNCSYGRIVSEWKIKDGKVLYHVVIPKNTIATVQLPGKKIQIIKAGDHHFTANTNQLNYTYTN